MRAIAKSPEERYRSAVELLDDLEKVRLGQQVSARPVVTPPHDLIDDLEATQIHKALVPEFPPGEQARMQGGKGADLPGVPPKKKVERWKIITGIAAGVLMLLIGGGIWLNSFFNVGTTKVPDHTNLTVDEAKDKLKAAGLSLDESKVTSDFSSKVAKDKIMEQDPKADSEVKEGRTVAVVVSKGANLLKVPDLSGMTLENAQKTLANNGFTGEIKTKEEASSDAVGTVTDQKPAADSQWPKDGEFTITLSSGPSGTSFNMPNLVGKAATEAQNTLSKDYGVTVLVESENSSIYPASVVVRTDPAPGEPLKKGDTVTITVSRGGSGPIGWEAKDSLKVAWQNLMAELTEAKERVYGSGYFTQEI